MKRLLLSLVVASTLAGALSIAGAQEARKVALLPQDIVAVWPFSEGLARIVRETAGPDGKKEKLEGYIDHSGAIVIEPAFREARSFHEGLAAAAPRCDAGNPACKPLFGYVDKKGAFVVAAQYEHALDFGCGLARIVHGGQTFFIDRTGKVVLDAATCAKFEKVWDFSPDCLARFDTKTLSGFIDKTGKVKFQRDANLQDFSEGLAVFESDGKTGFVDTNGKVVIAARDETTACPFHGGVTMFGNPPKWSVADKSGKSLLTIHSNILFAAPSEGLIAFGTSGRGEVLDGYMDMTGRVVIPARFGVGHAGLFSEGLADVRMKTSKGERVGFIDKSGEFTIEVDTPARGEGSEGICYPPSEDGWTGWYEDLVSHEELQLGANGDKIKVNYRAKSGIPFRELRVSSFKRKELRAVTDFGKKGENYLLQMSPDFCLCTCTNPDRTVQIFRRTIGPSPE